jgi:uncharacterized membrane protein
MKKTLTILFGVVMILAGIVHFLKPEIYTPFFPASFPQLAIVYFGGFIEIIVGVCALTPNYRSFGTLGIFILMIAFLPLHLIDVFKEKPVIGSHLLANIRLPFQFVFIAWAWFINKK